MSQHSKVPEELGRGGFGIVETVSFNNKVAARKIFNYDKTDNNYEDIKKRFLYEVKCQQRIKHLNVVRILSTCLNEDPPSFVMPLAHSTLQTFINNEPSVRNKVRCALMIFDGVEAIHKDGTVHRDIKPSNVLIFTNKNKYGQIYDWYCAISDFGLARNTSGEETSMHTQMGAIMGSELYTAPECFGRADLATVASDIYSLGVLLLSLFEHDCGLPYTTRTTSNSDDFLFPIVLKCTQKEATERYHSVAELRDAFNNARG